MGADAGFWDEMQSEFQDFCLNQLNVYILENKLDIEVYVAVVKSAKGSSL